MNTSRSITDAFLIMTGLAVLLAISVLHSGPSSREPATYGHVLPALWDPADKPSRDDGWEAIGRG